MEKVCMIASGLPRPSTSQPNARLGSFGMNLNGN